MVYSRFDPGHDQPDLVAVRERLEPTDPSDVEVLGDLDLGAGLVGLPAA